MFITPTKLQLDILSKILSMDKLDRFIGNGLADSLVLIGMLQKICNSPILLKATADKNKAKENQGSDVTNSVVHEALEYLPRKVHVDDVSLSGGVALIFNCVQSILTTGLQENLRHYLISCAQSGRWVLIDWRSLHFFNPSQNTDEKVAIVSHWASTLNIIEAFCKKKSYTYLRLDG